MKKATVQAEDEQNEKEGTKHNKKEKKNNFLGKEQEMEQEI